jgi:hypothetical protein
MPKITPPTGKYLLLNEGDYPLQGVPSLNAIATEHYGKQYVAQQTGDMLPNDSIHEFDMSEEMVHGEYSYELQDTRFYLGTNPSTRKPVFHEGHTQLDYWLSMSWSKDRTEVTHEHVYDWEDYYGAVFAYDFQAYRQAPGPQYILSDLILKEILPYGKYLLYVSW